MRKTCMYGLLSLTCVLASSSAYALDAVQSEITQFKAAAAGATGLADSGDASSAAKADCDKTKQAAAKRASLDIQSYKISDPKDVIKNTTCMDTVMKLSFSFGGSLPGVDQIIKMARDYVINKACGLVMQQWNQVVGNLQSDINTNITNPMNGQSLFNASVGTSSDPGISGNYKFSAGDANTSGSAGTGSLIPSSGSGASSQASGSSQSSQGQGAPSAAEPGVMSKIGDSVENLMSKFYGK